MSTSPVSGTFVPLLGACVVGEDRTDDGVVVGARTADEEQAASSAPTTVSATTGPERRSDDGRFRSMGLVMGTWWTTDVMGV
jgi:hypothetical protein